MTQADEQSWFNRNPKKANLILLCFVILLLEVTLRLAAWTGLYPYVTYPTTSIPVYWADIDPVVGVWHHPRSSFRQITSCFDVLYNSNAFGARDRERNLKSKQQKRFVVLGDSYVEGYGNARADRFTDILEAQRGYEFLNFGTSGNFGSIQEWLLYENLAMRFEHDAILIFLLPFNDFSDNDPADFPAERYRPYLRKKGNTFEVYYTVEFEQRKREFRKWSKVIKNSIDTHLYIANFLRWATRTVKNHFGLKKEASLPTVVPYNNYSNEDLDILLHSYKKIIQAAGSKPVYIFSIPSEDDFTSAINGERHFKIVKDLKSFADQYPQVHFTDLLDTFVSYAQDKSVSHDDFVLECDGHWGELGHKITAEAVEKVLFPAETIPENEH